MDNKVTCEFFIAMNEDGGWCICTDESEALSDLTENEGGYHARIIKVTLKMAPPKMAEATVDVSDEAGKTVEVVTK